MSEAISALAEPAQARKALERCIAAGGVAVFPADGLYGLACDPLNATAIERIHALKGRDPGKPSAVLYFSPLAMRELLEDFAPLTREAVASLLPGAVTAVVDNAERRYPLACGADPSSLGIRLIEGPLAGAMCPVFQTSANVSGNPAPAGFAQVDEGLREQADLVIDGGELSGEPSTVVDLTAIEAGGAWKLLREGAVPYAQIEQLLISLTPD